MQWKKTSWGKSKRKPWEKSYWLRRPNSTTQRYDLLCVSSELNKALTGAECYTSPPCRSRPTKRGSSSRSWSQSCESDKPKTTDLFTRAKTGRSRTSSQVGQKGPLKGPTVAPAASVLPGCRWLWSWTALLCCSAPCATWCRLQHIWSEARSSRQQQLLHWSCWVSNVRKVLQEV